MPNLVLKDYDEALSRDFRKPLKTYPRPKSFLRSFFIALVLIFLFLPIFVLVFFSFNSSEMNIIFENFTLEWYAKLFANSELLEAFKNTLIIAASSTVISTILGTIIAYGMYKFNFKSEKLVDKLIYIPIVIPEIVLGISLLAVLSSLGLELGLWSILLAHITFSTPFVVVSVRSVLFSLPRALEEAAADLGANNWQTFLKITLPLIKSGIFSGAILAFTLSLDDVVVSYFTAGPGTNTLPLYIYSIIKTGITPDVNALTTLMLLTTVVLLFISFKLRFRKAQE